MAEKDWQHKMNHFWIWKIISYRYLDHRKKRVFFELQAADDWWLILFWFFLQYQRIFAFLLQLEVQGTTWLAGIGFISRQRFIPPVFNAAVFGFHQASFDSTRLALQEHSSAVKMVRRFLASFFDIVYISKSFFINSDQPECGACRMVAVWSVGRRSWLPTSQLDARFIHLLICSTSRLGMLTLVRNHVGTCGWLPEVSSTCWSLHFLFSIWINSSSLIDS